MLTYEILFLDVCSFTYWSQLVEFNSLTWVYFIFVIFRWHYCCRTLFPLTNQCTGDCLVFFIGYILCIFVFNFWSLHLIQSNGLFILVFLPIFWSSFNVLIWSSVVYFCFQLIHVQNFLLMVVTALTSLGELWIFMLVL